jgi:RNA polymerase sigma factor (TIGR02999 family)
MLVERAALAHPVRGQGMDDTAGIHAPSATSTVGRESPDAPAVVYERVYGELRRIAHRQLAAEASGHTLSTTALVHEAWLRLAADAGARAAQHGQYLALAARAMRRILVDHARQRLALRRGGDPQRISWSAIEALTDGGAGALAVDDHAAQLIALDEALDTLATLDARAAEVVQLRFFAGLTEAESAGALGVTVRTVARDWAKARAVLSRLLEA